MFVSLVEPQSEGSPVETLGILISKTEDGTRGSITVLSPNGAQHTRHNVPIEGNQVENGVHIKLTPPANLTPPAPVEPPPEEPPADSFTVGS